MEGKGENRKVKESEIKGRVRRGEEGERTKKGGKKGGGGGEQKEEGGRK